LAADHLALHQSQSAVPKKPEDTEASISTPSRKPDQHPTAS